MTYVEAELVDVAWIGLIQYVIWKDKTPNLSCVVEFVWYLYLNPYAVANKNTDEHGHSKL